MKEIAQYFLELGEKGKRILVLGHPHADPDAISSVIALGEILEKLGAEVKIGIPGTLSKLSKSVLKSLEKNIETNPSLQADIIIVLDTSSLDQLKKYGEKIETSNSEIILIDHHQQNKKTRKKIDKYYGNESKIDKYYGNESTTSTAELILKIGREINHRFGQETALLLLTGIISDTGHLKFANEETFKAIAKLVEEGADYKKALKALETPEDPSKRVAMLKAAQRLEIHKAHGRWIAFSKIGAFESDAASLFIKIGADTAAVANDKKNEIRISSRSRRGLASETHLNLGELMIDLADKFNGTGGGHAGAAAMTVKADYERIKDELLKEIKKQLEPV